MTAEALAQARAKFAHLIKPCGGPCGRNTRSTKVPKALFEDTVIRVTASLCHSCHKALNPPTEADAAAEAAEQARKAKVAAERIAAAHRAREAVEADRAARRHRGAARRISLGQSTVRI